jgi:LDH2 family malate/lactate/ureidoglycolate dehydrogenase
MPLGGDEINSGYKGYGLAMMVELLCGLMSGSKYAQNIRHWTSYSEVADLGQCFIAVDPECFAPGLSDRLKVTGH